MTVRVQTAAFDPGAETNAFLAENAGAGAAVTFTGLVRSHPDDPVETLTFAAAHTRRIALATGVVNIPWYNPVLLARRLTTLDIFSGGRLRAAADAARSGAGCISTRRAGSSGPAAAGA